MWEGKTLSSWHSRLRAARRSGRGQPELDDSRSRRHTHAAVQGLDCSGPKEAQCCLRHRRCPLVRSCDVRHGMASAYALHRPAPGARHQSAWSLALPHLIVLVWWMGEPSQQSSGLPGTKSSRWHTPRPNACCRRYRPSAADKVGASPERPRLRLTTAYRGSPPLPPRASRGRRLRSSRSTSAQLPAARR